MSPSTYASERLDVDRLADHLDHARPGLLTRPLHAELIPGGRSNLTYCVCDAHGRELVLRRPPLGHVLPTAHNMAREYRLLTSLVGSAVPVPATELLCSDDDVLGAPFFLMERADGVAYRSRDQLEPLGPARVALICGRMLAALLDLHSVEPAEVGLADLGRPTGFLPRQVDRWQRQLERSCSRHLPGLAELHNRLAAGATDGPSRAIVHGDFRLDNLLIDASDEVVAVLDWEMATLGDPLTDLALLVAHTIEATRSPFRHGAAATTPGFPEPDGLVNAYAAASGRDLDGFGYYLALAFFKMVGILESIHYRYLAGKTVGIAFADAGARVPWLVEAGLTALRS